MASKERFDILFRARDEASGVAKKVTGSLTSVVGGVLSITVAMRALGAVISIGAQFEQTMASVGGVMRATEADMVSLTAAARKMGATTEFTATQAADALRFLGMAGFDANKAIAALPGTLDLATAGMLDLGTAADIATNVLTAMGLQVRELGRVNDVMVGTATRSNTTIQMMAESFKFAAPIARAYGVEIEQLSAMVGTLANAGLRGGIAGRNLATAMQRAQLIARRFNLESSDLVDVIESLTKAGVDNVAMSQLFGIESAKVVLVLKDSIAATREFETTLRGTAGESGKLAETMRDTTAGAIATMKSSFESLTLTIFESKGGIVRDLTEMTTAFLRVTNVVAGQETFWEQLASAVNAVGQSMSPAGVMEMLTAMELLNFETERAGTSFGVLLSDMSPVTAAIETQNTVLLEGANRWEEFWAAFNKPEDGAEAFDPMALPPALPPEVIAGAQRYNDAIAESIQLTAELSGMIQSGMVEAGVSILAVWDKTRANLADVFKGMATDFLRFFLNEIVKQTAAKIGASFFLKAIEVATGSPTAALPASAGGGGVNGIQQGKQGRGGDTIIVQGNIIGERSFVQKVVGPELGTLARLGALPAITVRNS